MGIMDFFKTSPNATPAVAASNAPVATSQPTAAANPAPVATAPLDTFKDLWQPVKDAQQPNTPLNIDSEKIMEIAGKANFASTVPAELVTQALKGDANAFTSAINFVGQQAFAQSTMTTQKLIAQALEQNNKNQETALPGMVKRQMVSDTLQTNPLYQHEATRPLLQALEIQLAAKHPNATANQIAEQAREFISQFASVAAGKPVETKQTKEQQQNDWSNFL